MSESIIFITGKETSTEVFSRLLGRRMGLPIAHVPATRSGQHQLAGASGLRARVSQALATREGLIVNAGTVDTQFHQHLIWLLRQQGSTAVWFHMDESPASQRLNETEAHPIIQASSMVCLRLQPQSQCLEQMLQLAQKHVEQPTCPEALPLSETRFRVKAPDQAPFHYRSRTSAS